MSRLVGRLVRTPVTVRWMRPLSLSRSAPASSDRAARSAALPSGVAAAEAAAEAEASASLPSPHSSPPFTAFFSLRASFLAASAALRCSFVSAGTKSATAWRLGHEGGREGEVRRERGGAAAARPLTAPRAFLNVPAAEAGAGGTAQRQALAAAGAAPGRRPLRVRRALPIALAFALAPSGLSAPTEMMPPDMAATEDRRPQPTESPAHADGGFWARRRACSCGRRARAAGRCFRGPGDEFGRSSKVV